MTSPLLPLLLSLCFAQAEEEEPPPQPPEPVWTWTRKEERELRKLEREVTGGASRCALEQTQWKVNTFGSARFAAEVGLYLDLFEATVLEQLDTKRQFSEAPTVVIYKTRTEFQEKAPMKSGAGLIYHAITEPPGKGKHRIKILDNHLYAYIENVEDPGLNDLDLRALRAEAAQAILIGVLGRPEVAIWFEKGVAEYFASWDLHEPPGQAPELRRARSPGLAALREQNEQPIVDVEFESEAAAREWNEHLASAGGSIELRHAIIRFRYDASDEMRRSVAAIYRVIADQEMPVRRVEMGQTTLEDLFLKIVQQ